MNIDSRLYVSIVPFQGDRPPQPHPIEHGRFDPAYVYKVLGIYNPSETGESYLILSNTHREIWFISNRHLRVFGLIDGDELFIESAAAGDMLHLNGKHRDRTNHGRDDTEPSTKVHSLFRMMKR
jgi:hypothetical protein